MTGLPPLEAIARRPRLAALLGAMCIAFSGIFYRYADVSPSTGRPAGPVAIATASTAATAVLIGLLVGDLDPVPSPPSLAWLGLLGVTSQSAGYLLISRSLPRLPAVLTSIILLAQPVATVGLAMALLAEAPSAGQLAGVGLVVGGIAVATLAPHRAPSG